MDYYDKKGNPLSLEEWIEYRKDFDHIVCQEYIDGYFISTVYLGLNHNFFEGPPLIFETMVFNHNPNIPDVPSIDEMKQMLDNKDFSKYPDQTKYSDLYMERYTTEEQALEGHKRIVEKFKAGTLPITGDSCKRREI